MLLKRLGWAVEHDIATRHADDARCVALGKLDVVNVDDNRD